MAGSMVRNLLASVGAGILTFFQVTGETVQMLLEVFRCLGKSCIRPRQTIEQMAIIGVNSLPIVLITVGFSGMVLALYTSTELLKLGASKYVGGLVGLSVAREIAPVITAIVVAARVGSAIAAELGTMTVTQQVDALRTLATSPIEYLVMPRFVAAVTMMPVLGIFANLTGIGGGYLVSVYTGVNSWTYINSVQQMVAPVDVMVGLIKTIPFAMIISIVSCHQGLFTTGGAAGVGRSTTSSVVLCIILIYCADYFLSAALPR